jgi:hypothetical protein
MPEPSRRERGRLVAERARGICEYCRSPESYSSDPFSVEHILPLQAGGSDEMENLAFACQGCNNFKYTKTTARDPVSLQLVPLFHPRIYGWRDHFIWNEDFSMILGTTPMGRATVEALRLNRPGLINLRRALFREGAHPPRDSSEAG